MFGSIMARSLQARIRMTIAMRLESSVSGDQKDFRSILEPRGECLRIIGTDSLGLFSDSQISPRASKQKRGTKLEDFNKILENHIKKEQRIQSP